MHVDNYDFYLWAKNQPKILCILGCVKREISRSEMVNAANFKNLPAISHVQCRPKYKLFHV
jgi:hypothetical protein